MTDDEIEERGEAVTNAILAIVGAITDPENQPHQWMGARDKLFMLLFDHFNKIIRPPAAAALRAEEVEHLERELAELRKQLATCNNAYLAVQEVNRGLTDKLVAPPP